MCKMNEYPGLYAKAIEIVRVKKIKPFMPGYDMLIKAIVIYKIQGKENLYEEVRRESAVIPLTDRPLQNMHPVEQLIFESMKTVGIDYENVMSFIEELASFI